MSELEGKGLTRREMLRKGVITGGAAVAWATPVVTAIGLTPMAAQTTSPVTTTTAPTTTTSTPNLDLSYIAINFTCPGSDTRFFSKFDDEGWSAGAGQVASQCAGTGITTANGVDATGKFSANLATGVVTALGDCTLLLAVGKKGSTCEVL
jgi:hypothetical protein